MGDKSEVPGEVIRPKGRFDMLADRILAAVEGMQIHAGNLSAGEVIAGVLRAEYLSGVPYEFGRRDIDGKFEVVFVEGRSLDRIDIRNKFSG